jgi:hypothetical protein
MSPPIIKVEHIPKGSEHTNSSSYTCSSIPPRSTTLRNSNSSKHNDNNNETKCEYDPVRVQTVSYHERLASYSATFGNDPQQQSKQAVRTADNDEMVQLLALQVYHLPGNSWLQDWLQYMNNNHPVFGICCHNKLHPIGSKTRCVALVGTIIFGLALTNAFYLFYLWNPEFDRTLATMVTNNGDTFVLTTGMLLLWTLG